MNSMIVAADAINVAQGGITAQSGEGLKNVLLGIIGSVLLIVVGGRMLAALTEERYGKMLSLIAGGAAVALFAYMPDVGVGILKGFATLVTGGGAA